MFDELQKIASYLGTELEKEGREKLILLLATAKYQKNYESVLIDLLIAYGLHPHINEVPSFQEHSSLSSAINYEFHTKENFTFHPHQKFIYDKVKNGENIILSAPTSYGKTSIVIELIKEFNWNNIVLIFPTLALVDENRRKLVKITEENFLNYSIITSQAQNTSDNNIYILTAERFLSFLPSIEVDFFLIDEFYKLDSDGDDRRIALNIAWKKLSSSGAQYCLFGPYIDGLSDKVPANIRENFIETDISTVATKFIDRSDVTNKVLELKNILADVKKRPTIIYTKSPAQAKSLINSLDLPFDIPPFVKLIAQWINNNYFDSWVYVFALTSGYALHYGPLPRSIQRLSLLLFNNGFVHNLICTSTLIEGTNTVAENIVIFDNKIANKKFDYFTYKNIAGRSGRLGQYLVGYVYCLEKSPEKSNFQIDIPIESQSEKVTPQEIIHADIDVLNTENLQIFNTIKSNQYFTIDFLKSLPGFDPNNIIQTAEILKNMSSIDHLIWSGNPTYQQREETLRFALVNLRGINGTYAFKIVKMLNNFITSRTIREVIQKQARYCKRGEDPVALVLDFQRSELEFRVPAVLSALEKIIKDLFPSISDLINYDYFIQQIENSFGPPYSKHLEEIGLPFPLTQKIYELVGREHFANYDSVINMLTDLPNSELLKSFDPVEQYILADVIAGLQKR